MDEYLEGIMNRGLQEAEVHVIYAPAEQAARAELIALIEAEKRAYFERIEPYIRKLSTIPGRPTFVIKTAGLR